MRNYFLFVVFIACMIPDPSLRSQNKDSLKISSLYKDALTSNIAYQNLNYLCKHLNGRITGSPQAAKAVVWSKQVMTGLKADTVYLQETKVPHWVRGEKETAKIISDKFGTTGVHVCALGGAVGTGENGVAAEVVEVLDFDQLEGLGESKIKGKIVFFNRAVDMTFINTFRAYGGAVDQRFMGPFEAAKYGAIGVVIRSVSTAMDTVPHTGISRYKNWDNPIPSVAISTIDADILHNQLMQDPELTFYFHTSCEWLPDETSDNVVAEIKGSEFPDEYITIGGHLDCWDLGEGAHDDGAGCIQTMEVLRLFRKLNIQPRQTIRFVMFMDEEIGQSGGKTYAELAKARNEKHYLALEADRGGFTPTGFSIDAPADILDKIESFRPLFEPYGADRFVAGGGGTDIGQLKDDGAILSSLVVDSQRYFDYHHSANDTFDKVNKRELQLGSASIAAFIYLMDKYNFKRNLH